MLKRKINSKVVVLAGAFLLGSIVWGQGVFAASDTTTGGSSGSYTRAMGASKTAKFSYSITANGGAYEAQIKDPYIWHTRKKDSSLSKGKSGSFTRSEGSKNAYWRGRIVNGTIKVTV